MLWISCLLSAFWQINLLSPHLPSSWYCFIYKKKKKDYYCLLNKWTMNHNLQSQIHRLAKFLCNYMLSLISSLSVFSIPLSFTKILTLWTWPRSILASTLNNWWLVSATSTFHRYFPEVISTPCIVSALAGEIILTTQKGKRIMKLQGFISRFNCFCPQ